MGWYSSSWTRRKKLTIPAASVVGGGTLTDFALPVLGLGSDADIKASAHGTGRDLVFTAADGTTKLAHDLIPKQQWLSQRGAAIWYTWPWAVHSASANKTWFCISQGTGTTASDCAIGEYNHATGAYTRTVLLANASYDDHNNPSVCRRSTDSKLVAVYTQHNDTVIRQKVSTNANDSTAWGAETTLDPFPGSPSAYSFASIMELEALGLLVMFVRVGQHQWAYGYSSNSGTPSWTWVNFQDSTFDGTRYKLYWRFKKTGSGRIDIAGCLDPVTYTTASGNNGSMTVYHAYFDGGWKKTDGTVMSSGHPSSPFVKANFTAVYAGSASDNLWVEDVDVDASGKPRISFPRYPSSVKSDQRLMISSWSGSAWSTQDLGLTGGGVSPGGGGAIGEYTGCTSFVCGNAADVYVGVEVSGKYEIQLWRESGGTYAKADDITTGSDENQFRPGTVYGAVSGKPQVMWMAGQYPNFSTYRTGLRVYPACGSYYQAAVVKTDISGATDTDIYVYYGNASAAPQLDPANAYNSNYLSVLRRSRWIDKADPWKVYDHKGVQSLVTTNDLATEPTQFETNFGEAWSFGSTKTSTTMAGMRLTGLNLQALAGCTLQFLARATFASGSPQTLMSSATGSADGADVLFRWNTSSPNTTGYIHGNVSSPIGSSPYNSGVAPTTNTTHWQAMVFDGSAHTLKSRTDTTEGTFASGFADSTAKNTATKTMYYGIYSIGGNPLYGYMTEVRISNVARTKAWTDTESAAMSTGIVTFGAEESPLSLSVTSGAYVISGSGVVLSIVAPLIATSGTYSITGNNVALSTSVVLSALTGSYAYTGSDVGLTASRQLAVTAGSYAITGNVAGLNAARLLTATPGAYSISGNSVILTYNTVGSYTLNVTAGSYAITGNDVALVASRALAVTPGAYAITGNDVVLTYGVMHTLNVTPGSYEITGYSAMLAKASTLQALAGAYAYTGRNVVLTYSGLADGALDAVSLLSIVTPNVQLLAVLSQSVRLDSPIP